MSYNAVIFEGLPASVDLKECILMAKISLQFGYQKPEHIIFFSYSHPYIIVFFLILNC